MRAQLYIFSYAGKLVAKGLDIFYGHRGVVNSEWLVPIAIGKVDWVIMFVSFYRYKIIDKKIKLPFLSSKLKFNHNHNAENPGKPCHFITLV